MVINMHNTKDEEIVTKSNPYKLPVLIIIILLTILAGIWLVLNMRKKIYEPMQNFGFKFY